MNYNSIFSERDGLRFILEKKFNERKSNEFPNDDINYVNVYKQLEDHLNAQIHPETEKGAILNGSGLLTDHGASHVSMVIQRAGLLLNDNINKLSEFEIFIFLLATHFHDVGNILGREKHEEKIMDIMQKVRF
jgi:metal-dependent HD superfamily phosphatase/phosphodiesterase